MKQLHYITALRFPLALLVVLIHCDIAQRTTGANSQFADIAPLCEFFSKRITAVAVPMFFVISGFLFFRGKQEFTLADYKAKLQSRVTTLVVPYVAWNLVAFLIYAAKDLAAGQSLQFPLSLNLFWGVRELSGGSVNILGQQIGATLAPVQVPLWFVRDLIVLAAASPVLHFLIKRLGVLALIVFGLLCFMLWPNIGGITFKGAFWFGIGAWFAIRAKDPLASTRRFLWPCVAGTFVSLALRCTLQEACPPAAGFFDVLYVMCAMVSLLHLAAAYTRRRKPNAFLASSSFFLYAFHTIPIFAVIALFPRLGENLSVAMQTVCYVGCYAIAVGSSLAAFAVARRCGKWTAPLTGIWK